MFGTGERGKKRKRRSAAPHEDFLELCALSTTGGLSEEERNRLQDHLAGCDECRQALAEFEAAANIGAPLVAAELATSEPTADVLPLAEDRDRTPLEQTDSLTRNPGNSKTEKGFLLAHGNGYDSTQLNWNNLWMPITAAVALIIALGIYTYQTGKQRGVEVAQITSSHNTAQNEVNTLEQQMSDAGHDRELLTVQLAERDRLIRQLRKEMQTQSAELAEARNTEAALERSSQANQVQNAQITQQRSALAEQLLAAETSLKKTQGELASLQNAREQDDVRVASLSDQIKDLYGELRGREQTINQQQAMLSEDRDIRDLMGARNLYIAEVYDVGRDGTTRKPYGRVFYTKGKSLIFYAYDLDGQPGVKKTSTFQAWGQDGPDRQRALNLGIFYQDSAAQKRWVLKFDNASKLEQINAVFVTVEPHGGSREPSGKRLLFASLRIEPNHP
jgi:hypothetical protein